MNAATYNLLLLAPLIVALVAAAVVDLRSRRIPNWLTAPLAVGGLVASVAWDGPVAGGWGWALAGLLAGLALNLPLFLLRIRGGGDVKLFAAVGAWIGPVPIFAVFLVSTVLAMVLALVQAAAQRRLRPVLENSAAMAVGTVHGVDPFDDSPEADRLRLPYAVPVLIAVATLVALG